MKKGNKLYDYTRKHYSDWKKQQRHYTGLSESQIKELVKSEDFDQIPSGGSKSMSGRRVYGYDSLSYERGWTNWNYVSRWLLKRVGKPREKVEEEFIQLWKNGKMSQFKDGGPLENLRSYVDEEPKGNFRHGFFWNEKGLLQAYTPRTWYKNKFPDYSTIEKRKANKIAFEEAKSNLMQGKGPIPIGSYYISEDRGQKLHPCYAIRTDIWNQGLPEDQKLFKSDFKVIGSIKGYPEAVKIKAELLNYYHDTYVPVNILGIGSTHLVPAFEPTYSYLTTRYFGYIFVTPK